MKLLHLFWLPVLIFIGLELFLNHRVYDLERQDKGEKEGRYTHEEYVDMMHMLAEANLADPNGYNATLAVIESLRLGSISSIVEIGFGLGHFSVMLANRFPDAQVVGIDAHQFSVDSANSYLEELESRSQKSDNVRFELRRESELKEMRKSFDLITTTFVNHHIFPDETFIEFLRQIAVVGRKAFVFNDFHRSTGCILDNEMQFLALRYIGIENTVKYIDKIKSHLPSSLLSSLPMIDHVGTLANRFKEAFASHRPGLSLVADGGRLSMRRSFSLKEYTRMFKAAGYPDDALVCHRLDRWYMPGDSCRVVCVADLTWSK